MKGRAAEVMHLVEDEWVGFPTKRGRYTVRLRIWRHRKRVPVVLVSVPYGIQLPGFILSRAADYVFTQRLGFAAAGMSVYCWDDSGLAEVVFRPIGNQLRLRHADPRRIQCWRDNLEGEVGQFVGR